MTDWQDRFHRMPLVAILRGLVPENAVEVGDRLAENGFAMLEVPLNSPDPLESIARLAKRHGGQALVGAGTVLSVQDVAPIADALAAVQAGGLFACTLALGIPLTAVKPTGFIGMKHPDSRIVRKLSIIMLALTAIALAWSIVLVHNIRLGGALPFIVLNVTRRMLMRRRRPSVLEQHRG